MYCHMCMPHYVTNIHDAIWQVYITQYDMCTSLNDTSVHHGTIYNETSIVVLYYHPMSHVHTTKWEKYTSSNKTTVH